MKCNSKRILNGLVVAEGNLSLMKLIIPKMDVERRADISRNKELSGVRVGTERAKHRGDEAQIKVKASGPINPGKGTLTAGMIGTGCVGMHSETAPAQ